MADAAAAAVDLILARRAWAVVVRDNDHDNYGKGLNGWSVPQCNDGS